MLIMELLAARNIFGVTITSTDSMKLAAIPIVLLAILVGAHFRFRKLFKVHTDGVVLVTGASSGIGRDAAVRLAESGYHVFAGVRTEEDARKVLNLQVTNLFPVMLDVTSHASCIEAVATVALYSGEKNLPVVALVNNAGISRRIVAEFHDIDDIRKVFDTNVFGLIDITQLMIQLLRNSNGRIVMISSIAGFFGKFLF